RFASLMLLGLASPAAAAPIAHREVLPNGIVLLVAERPAVPIVAVRALVQAGAVHDPPDRAGLANLTGGLLPRGTHKRTGPGRGPAVFPRPAPRPPGGGHTGIRCAAHAWRRGEVPPGALPSGRDGRRRRRRRHRRRGAP